MSEQKQQVPDGPWSVEHACEHSYLVYYDLDAGPCEMPESCAESVAELLTAAPELLAMVQRYASGCGTCHGKGYTLHFATAEQAPCLGCKEAPELIGKASGK